MSKNNNRHPQKAMGNPPKKTGNAFLRYAYDKRIMLPVICFFCVAIVALSVLLILDSTGILYSGHGNVQGGDSVSAGNVELADGVIHTSGNYQYRLLKDGTAELYYYTAHTSTEVDIPAKLTDTASQS
ncbi:MAG: hypothetical protein IKB34_02185 [Clostridia bacterium]|nr:hypothetical protein [Clostridia bacterium]